jgi:hypothetical protein
VATAAPKDFRPHTARNPIVYLASATAAALRSLWRPSVFASVNGFVFRVNGLIRLSEYPFRARGGSYGIGFSDEVGGTDTAVVVGLGVVVGPVVVVGFGGVGWLLNDVVVRAWLSAVVDVSVGGGGSVAIAGGVVAVVVDAGVLVAVVEMRSGRSWCLEGSPPMASPRTAPPATTATMSHR